MNTEPGDSDYCPLEKRIVEITGDNGVRKRVPAFSKTFAPEFDYIEFYLVRVESIVAEPSLLDDWEELMKLYQDDLQFLLGVPHHVFWSTVAYSGDVTDKVLTSYLVRAPRPYESAYQAYFGHPRMGPLLTAIREYIFRILLRLSTFKESKEDYISHDRWAALIYDHDLFSIPKLMDLAVHFGQSHKHLVTKMMENVFSHQPQFLNDFKKILRVCSDKWMAQTQKLAIIGSHLKNLAQFEDVIAFNIDHVVSLYKLIELYPPFATSAHSTRQFETTLAITYEQDVQEWKNVVHRLPQLERQVNKWRVYMVRLFRLVSASATALTSDVPDNSCVDDFFGVISNCLELCIFLHDYNTSYPFHEDIKNLRKRGVYIDPTRVEYLSNAFECAVEACGGKPGHPRRITEPKESDPLEGAAFDRQLLGACSLDVVGPELVSLVSQVKDLLPDLSDSYIEACLKHYGYESEAVINAILEGSVPPQLGKYVEGSIDPKNDNKLQLKYTREIVQDIAPSRELKQRILECLEAQESGKWTTGQEAEGAGANYLEKSLLPAFREDVEYDDEYDDTYDEAGMGMTEPDAIPLNTKLERRYVGDEDDEEGVESSERRRGFEAFTEDPALVRARMEQKRATQNRGQNQRGRRDVLGAGKGHGQSAEVVLNRRRKDEAGSHNRRKGADFKRRQF